MARGSTLDRQDWFRAGLEALAKSGPRALRATTLARDLGVTTGSFYWHFEHVAQFRAGLLAYWHESVVMGVMRSAQARATDPSRVFGELGKYIQEAGTHRFDTALRAWAETDPEVKHAVERSDRERGAFMVQALRDAGLSEAEARDRVALIGAAWRGSQDLQDADRRMRLMALTAPD